MVLWPGIEIRIENHFLPNFEDIFLSPFASKVARVKSDVNLILFPLLGYTFHLSCEA